ncbi:hypothetical protein [Tardiphaga sp.]|jgi:hypothetical protein|uniref:hypothetical protein n=1 Tax=Tardiphaga sp. TaxID=1926292 RepID=UPI0037D9CDE2
MSETQHFVQKFRKKGRMLIGAQPELCKTPEQAKVRGEKAAEHSVGVVVFSVTGEPEFGEFESPVVVAKYGETPAEFG